MPSARRRLSRPRCGPAARLRGLLRPDECARVLAIATTARHSAQNIAFHEVGRQAIMADPNWRDGDYYGHDDKPGAGLAVARMAAGKGTDQPRVHLPTCLSSRRRSRY